MGRTNIKTPSRGSEYFIRPYARGKNDTYMDVSQQVTQSYVDSQVVTPHSIFSRPYLAGNNLIGNNSIGNNYQAMEYEYNPTIPVIPPFDPTTVPGGVLIVPEAPEVPEVPSTPGEYLVGIITYGTSVYSAYDVSPQESWDVVRGRSTGTNYTGLARGYVSSYPTAPATVFMDRGFIKYDLSAYVGTVTSARITGPVQNSGVLQISLATWGEGSFPIREDDFSAFTGGALCNLSDIDSNSIFNPDGIDYIQSKLGGTIDFCVREDHDFDDNDPREYESFFTRIEDEGFYITIV